MEIEQVRMVRSTHLFEFIQINR